MGEARHEVPKEPHEVDQLPATQSISSYRYSYDESWLETSSVGMMMSHNKSVLVS